MNTAGHAVHARLGFGWLQADVLLASARAWSRPRPGQAQVSSGVLEPNVVVAAGNGLATATASFPPCLVDAIGLVRACVNQVEHVVVRVETHSARRGDLRLTLVSPAGTHSTLMGPRTNDHSSTGFTLEWALSTVHFWDETLPTDAAATWTLQVVNTGQYSSATLQRWELRVYGSLADDVLASTSTAAPPVAATHIRPSDHHPPSVLCAACLQSAYVDGLGACRACHSNCSRGCFGPGPGGCIVEEAPSYRPPSSTTPVSTAAVATLAILAVVALVLYAAVREQRQRQRQQRVQLAEDLVTRARSDGVFVLGDSDTDTDSDDERGRDGVRGRSREAGETHTAPDAPPAYSAVVDEASFQEPHREEGHPRVTMPLPAPWRQGADNAPLLPPGAIML